MDRRNLGILGITDFYSRMHRQGFTQGQAYTLFSEYVNGTLEVSIKVEAPYITCEVTKYFEVIVRNERRTPKIRFELRAELTIPTEIAEPRAGEEEYEWRSRFQDYLNERVEPVFDRALDRWGNGTRTVVQLDGKVVRYQNTLDLDSYTKRLSVLGVEKFDGTAVFKSDITFEIAKYKNDHLSLVQPQNLRIGESELR